MQLPQNLNNLPLTTLYRLRHEADVFLFKQAHGGEDYTATYKKDPNFDEFISKTVEMKDQVKAYFRNQKRNLDGLVYLNAIVRADDQEEQDEEYIYLYPPGWEEENKKFAGVLFDAIFPLIMIGVLSMEQEKGYSSAIHTDSSAAIADLREYSIRLAGEINETTRRMIVEHIKTSTALGEDKEKLTDRLKSVLDNERRAELIAQTESVRAHNEGRRRIADELGLTMKTWEAGWGACPICVELSTVTVKINEQFPGGYDKAPAHPRCKCSIRYS